MVKKKGLEKGLLVLRCGLGGMGFFFLSSLLFPGIHEFQFRENSRSRILRVHKTIDCLIDRLIRSLDSSIAKNKNSVYREHNKFRRSRVQKFPLIAKFADRGKYGYPVFIFHTKSKFEFALTFWKKIRISCWLIREKVARWLS